MTPPPTTTTTPTTTPTPTTQGDKKTPLPTTTTTPTTTPTPTTQASQLCALAKGFGEDRANEIYSTFHQCNAYNEGDRTGKWQCMKEELRDEFRKCNRVDRKSRERKCRKKLLKIIQDAVGMTLLECPPQE